MQIVLVASGAPVVGIAMYAAYLFISGLVLLSALTKDRLDEARRWSADADWTMRSDESRFQAESARARWARYIELLHVKLRSRLKWSKRISVHVLFAGALVDTVVLAFFSGDSDAAGALLMLDVFVKVSIQLRAARQSLQREADDLERQERDAMASITETIRAQRREKRSAQVEEDPHTRADKLFEDFAHALGHADAGVHSEVILQGLRSRFASEGEAGRIPQQPPQAGGRRRASLVASKAVPTNLAGTRMIAQYEGIGGTARSS